MVNTARAQAAIDSLQAALAVFLWMGVRPRTWLEQRSARQSRRLALIVWAGLLITLLIAILLLTDKLPV